MEPADFLGAFFFFGGGMGLFGWEKKDAALKNNMTNGGIFQCHVSFFLGGGILDKVPLTPPDTIW